ncbi:MAG: transketolase family protein [Negativicutes bacterium]
MLDDKDMSVVLCDKLIELATKDERIVFVEADSLTVTGIARFKQQFPDRTFNVGIAEANMIGVAAGLANCGKIPVVSSFTPFATRRCFDQIVISASYAGLALKIIGLNPGITTEMNGGTHMSLEDVGIMRTIPGITIVEPVDVAQLQQVLPALIQKPGVDYLRFFKGRTTKIYDENCSFTLGKGNVLVEGKDIAIIATGIMTQYALAAATELKAEGIQAKVVHLHSVKPLDEQLILSSAHETGAVLTVENHSIIGGLGSAVAECISEHCPVRMKRMGVCDRYGEVGTIPYLLEEFGLTVADIVAEAKALIKNK